MAVVTIGEALRRYEAEVGPARASMYVAIVRRYLEEGGTNTDSSLTAYLRRLEHRRLRPSTIDLHRRTIGSFYRHLGMTPPRARGITFDREDVARPALSADLVAAMVGAARAGQLHGWDAALLALSTVYGMRAVELSRLKDDDVDRDGRRLYVRTAKHGLARWCWLPPELLPWLPSMWPRASEGPVEGAFGRIWGAAVDTPKPDRVAWHAVRRALQRDLAAAGVSEEDAERFGRWRAGQKSMVRLYRRPNLTVGAQGVERAREENEGTRAFDGAVWDHHPYLELWR